LIPKKARQIYLEFPSTFWTLIGATFIDRLGGALIFPFLALYVTYKFNVGMTEVGQLFAIFAIASLFGNLLSGAMTDKFGRRVMLLFGLVFSALSSLTMGFVNDLGLFYSLAGLVGLLSNTGGPAQQAMVADLLPEEKQTEGYGILRVSVNLAVTIGPAIGGLLASVSYLYLFIGDAITSLITAGVVLMVLPETKPQASPEQAGQSMLQTMGGYRTVLRDSVYIAFLVASTLMVIVYMQMNSTLSVYLRDVHAVSTQGYGYILSLNAGMVVLFQFWVTRRTRGHAPMLMMALGALFYAVGFAMYGFVSSYVLFLLAMAVITIGEMIVSPVAQALVARLAPSDMRGRYMAIYGFTWIIPTATGPLAAGIVMDNYNPDWVWYLCGLLGLLTVFVYLGLNPSTEKRLTMQSESQPAPQTPKAHPAD
jgi:MFS family permease